MAKAAADGAFDAATTQPSGSHDDLPAGPSCSGMGPFGCGEPDDGGTFLEEDQTVRMIMFIIVGCMVGTVLSLPFISNSAPVNPLQISIGSTAAGADKVVASTAH